MTDLIEMQTDIDWNHQTRMAMVNGWAIYEHPTLGDEVPLIAVGGGKAYYTNCFDFYDLEEVLPQRIKLEGKIGGFQ